MIIKIFLHLIIFSSIFFIFNNNSFCADTLDKTQQHSKISIIDERINKLLIQAQLTYDNHDYENAKNQYKQILLVSNGESVKAHEGYISCAENLKQLTGAIQYYTEHIKENKNTPGWYFGLGLCYLKKGDKKQATFQFNRVLELTFLYKGSMYDKCFELAKEYSIELVEPKVKYEEPMDLKIKLFLLVILLILFRFYIKRVVDKNLIKYEGVFEVYNSKGLKIYILDCSDKGFRKKYGDVLSIGSTKGCDIFLNIKDEEKKIYATMEADKINKQNHIIIKPYKDEEIYMEVPRSRYSPDEMVKLPFSGGPLWDKDIINIKDYRIHYSNLKLSKRLLSDYPESAKKHLYYKGVFWATESFKETQKDDNKPKVTNLILPDLSALYPPLSEDENRELYESLKEIKLENKEKFFTSREEVPYEIEPMEEKYYIDSIPIPSKTDSPDVLSYKVDEQVEEVYQFSPLPEIKGTADKEDILSYPKIDENEPLEYDVLPSVKPDSNNSENVLSYPVPTEDEDKLLGYQENISLEKEVKKDIFAEEAEILSKFSDFSLNKVEDFDISTKKLNESGRLNLSNDTDFTSPCTELKFSFQLDTQDIDSDEHSDKSIQDEKIIFTFSGNKEEQKEEIQREDKEQIKIDDSKGKTGKLKIKAPRGVMEEIQNLMKELKLNPDNKEIRKNLIVAYTKTSSPWACIPQCSKLIVKDPSESSWVIDLYKELTEKYPDNKEIRDALVKIQK